MGPLKVLEQQMVSQKVLAVQYISNLLIIYDRIHTDYILVDNGGRVVPLKGQKGKFFRGRFCNAICSPTSDWSLANGSLEKCTKYNIFGSPFSIMLSQLLP